VDIEDLKLASIEGKWIHNTVQERSTDMEGTQRKFPIFKLSFGLKG
jgi:hypothetical protein